MRYWMLQCQRRCPQSDLLTRTRLWIVALISPQGQLTAGKLDADLMGTSGFQLNLHQ